MKRKRVTAVFLLTFACLVLLFCLVVMKYNGRVVEIKGQVTSISNECAADGTCTVTLDSKKYIVTGCGLTADGSTCASYDQSQLKIGDQVTAKVKKAGGDSYNLECSGCDITKTD